MSWLVGSRKTLSVDLELDRSAVYVYPDYHLHSASRSEGSDALFDASLAQGPRSEDTLIQGKVVVTLAKPRLIRGVRVTFEGSCNAFGGPHWAYENSILHARTLDLSIDKEEIFGIGRHEFRFAFIVPPDTAVYQKSRFGRVRHTVRATVEAVGKLNFRVHSEERPVKILANPFGPGELPPPFHSTSIHMSEDLGLIGLTLSSPLMSLSSVLRARLLFLSTPQQVAITNIVGYIVQTFTIKYNDKRMAHPESSMYPLSKIAQSCLPEALALDSRAPPDPEHMMNLKAQEEWAYSCVFRLPDEGTIRPSTLPATKTKIHVSHRICLEVYYKTAAGACQKVVKLGQNVNLYTCCCSDDGVFLPRYDSVAPSPEPDLVPSTRRCPKLMRGSTTPKLVRRGAPLAEPNTPSFPPPAAKEPASSHPSHCVCRMSVQDCLDNDGDAIIEITPPSDATPPMFDAIAFDRYSGLMGIL